MKIFAVRDEDDKPRKNLAYLFYHEKSKRFYVELPQDANEWDTPLLLSAYAMHGKLTVDAAASLLWVRQRIIPQDRQNIREILRDNGLKEYDEYKLLHLAKGRCAQDSYPLVPLKEENLPKEIEERLQRHIEDVIPLDDFNLLVFFKDGSTRKINLPELVGEDRLFAPVLKNDYLFRGVNVLADGFAIAWGKNLELTYDMLWQQGVEVPLTRKDFLSFVDYRVLTTSQATDLLDCTRQNINYLVDKDKLHTINKDDKVRLFLKQDLLEVG